MTQEAVTQTLDYSTTYTRGQLRLGLRTTDQGLRELAWLSASVTWPRRRHPMLTEARQALDQYFASGCLPESVSLDMSGLSPFRRKVMLTLAREVGPGQLITYGELACLVGHPGAARAVGTVMSRNPLPIFIPCHRVVGTTGPGGFGPGLRYKQEFLRLEGVELKL